MLCQIFTVYTQQVFALACTLSTFRRTTSVSLAVKLPSAHTKVKMYPTPSSNRSPPSSAKDSKRGKRRRRDDVDKLGEAAGRGNKDGDSYSTLGKLVSKATKPTRETGYKHLDDDTVRRIKAIAKQDDNCSDGAIRYLMQRMAAKSAEVRYMALSIVGILFQRSRVVRSVVVADLKSFMNLAVGHDARQPLPGPPAAAAALRQKALGLLEEWNEAHGDVHKGLRAAYRFLREGKRMKFPEVQARAVREREELAARREKHAQRLLRAKYFQAKGEIQDQAPDIDTMVREMRECFDILLPVVPGTDAIALVGNAIDLPNTGGAASAPSLSVHVAPLGEEAAEDSSLKQGIEERVRQAEVADGEEDSDDAEGMEWEEGGEQGGDNSNDSSDHEEETGERTVSAKLRRVDGIGGTLRTVADTVEAAGLGTSGYELQIEVPMGLSLTTGASDGDTALVTSALRERYKVLTRRLLPLLSEWIQTLSRVHFDDEETNPNSTGSSNTIGTGPGNRGTEGSREDIEGDAVAGRHHNAFAERPSCAFLLSRCLATRAAANTVVSKYLELKIDEDSLGGARRATAEGTTSGIGGWNHRSNSDARGLKKDKSRLQIRIDNRKEGQL